MLCLGLLLTGLSGVKCARLLQLIELLSNHRLDMLQQKRSSQVETAIRELFELWVRKGCAETGVLVDMKHWFGDLMFSVFLRMVAGKQHHRGGADCEEGEAQSRCFLSVWGIRAA